MFGTTQVENYFFDIRKQLFEYDQVLNQQREKLYAERRKTLLASDLQALMIEYAEETVEDIVEANIDPEMPVAEWDLEGLTAKMVQYCHMLEGVVTVSTFHALFHHTFTTCAYIHYGLPYHLFFPYMGMPSTPDFVSSSRSVRNFEK